MAIVITEDEACYQAEIGGELYLGVWVDWGGVHGESLSCRATAVPPESLADPAAWWSVNAALDYGHLQFVPDVAGEYRVTITATAEHGEATDALFVFTARIPDAHRPSVRLVCRASAAHIAVPPNRARLCVEGPRPPQG